MLPMMAMQALAGGGGKSDVLGVIWKVLRWVTGMLLLWCMFALVWFFVNNPPRPAGPHNFARGSSEATREAFRGMLVRFWDFYGEEMREWWAGLAADRSDEGFARLLGICEEWRDRGAKTVFNTLYLEANYGRGEGNTDLWAAFYRYPGRNFDGWPHGPLKAEHAEGLRVERDGADWPALAAGADWGADLGTWFDVEEFDPRQEIGYGDPAYDLEGFHERMLAVERVDLLLAALPHFVATLHGRHAFFRHVAIDSLPDTADYLAEHGEDDLSDPGLLPELVLRYGVKRGDPGCTALAAERLAAAACAIDDVFVTRVHSTVAGNTELAASVARNTDPGLLVDFQELGARELADRLEGMSGEKGTALYHASHAMRGWRAVGRRADELVAQMRDGYVNLATVKEFVRRTSREFETAMTDFLEAMRLADAEGNLDRSALSAEYSLWHGALDVLRAIEDDTVLDAVRQVKGLGGDVSNPVLRACGSVTERIRTMYEQYVNAINCAVYAESYIDDAKLKFNVRHTNPLAARTFYKVYFNDLFQAYWNKDTYRGGGSRIPPASCVDCFEPHVSPLGQVYNQESLREYTYRFWQHRGGGIGAPIMDKYRSGVKKALRRALTDCEFSAAFVRKLLGEEFDGKGFYGGRSNRVAVYNVVMEAGQKVWSVEDEDWIANDALQVVPWYWDGVANGSEIVFEDCLEGGTLIYSRYPARAGEQDGFNAYLSVDDRGVARTDNWFHVPGANFSLCRTGAAGLDATRLDEGTAVAPPDETTERDILGAARGLEETFAPEPNEDADYCYPDDRRGDGRDARESGLFQVIDVQDPPRNLHIEAVRKAVIVSRSPRLDDPRYRDRRLLTLGYSHSRRAYVPVFVNDTPANRARSVMSLIVRSVATTSMAVLGFPDEERGAYTLFLDQGLSRKSIGIKDLTDVWILVGVMVAAAVVAAVTLGAGSAASAAMAASAAGVIGAKTIAAAATAVAAYGSVKTATVVAVGAGVFASGAAIAEAQRQKKALGTSSDVRRMHSLLKETQQFVENLLDSSKADNPFTVNQFRFMLVLEKPGLWPEFALVPYTRPSQCVGSDKPGDASDLPGARLVPRDRTAGSNNVVLIPATDTNRGSVRRLYPPMLSEHGADNFQRRGDAFYLYSPHKRMFLLPTDPPTWIYADGDPERSGVKVQLTGRDLVMDVRGGSDDSNTPVQLYGDRGDGATNQVFMREVVGDGGAGDPAGMPFVLRSLDGLYVAEAGGRLVGFPGRVNASVFMRLNGRLAVMKGQTTAAGGEAYDEVAGYVQAASLGAGDQLLVRRGEAGERQYFSFSPVTECSDGAFRYDVENLVRGDPAGVLDCVRPWYVYQIAKDDLTVTQGERLDKEFEERS